MIVDGGMVRAAAHLGGETGRTGAVRSASMTPIKRNPQVSRWRAGPRREQHRRNTTLHTGSCGLDPQSSCRPRNVRRTLASSQRGTVDRHDAHKDPASSAASRWALESIFIKPSDDVQNKRGGQPLVEL